MNEKLFNAFLKKAKLKFGDKFNYSKVDYIKGNLPVTIICPIHGEFQTTPTQFLQSKHGCKKCAIEKSHNKTRHTTEQFINKAKEVWGNKYTYEKTKYVDASTKVLITCPIHGDFLARPSDFLRKHGCPKCKGDKTAEFNKLTKSSNTEEFSKRCELLYPNLFDYSKVNYIRNNVNVIIHSNLYNEDFIIQPFNMLKGNIPKKYLGLDFVNTTVNQETFISRAKFLRPEFDYSETKYTGFRNKIKVICPEHGPFWIYPTDLLYKNGGCPICGSSHGEKVVLSTLQELKIDFNKEHEVLINGHKRRIDFIIRLTGKYIYIEYNGRQHYEPVDYFGGEEQFKLQIERDQQIREYCKLNNIILLEYKYDIPFYNLRLKIREDIKKILNE